MLGLRVEEGDGPVQLTPYSDSRPCPPHVSYSLPGHTTSHSSTININNTHKHKSLRYSGSLAAQLRLSSRCTSTVFRLQAQQCLGSQKKSSCLRTPQPLIESARSNTQNRFLRGGSSNLHAHCARRHLLSLSFEVTSRCKLQT